MKIQLKSIALGLFATCLLASACNQQDDPMVIRAEAGKVKGIEQEGTMAFLGIPYAKVERFMPPLPVDKWDTVRVCDHWGPQAMQPTNGRPLGEDEMSEN